MTDESSPDKEQRATGEGPEILVVDDTASSLKLLSSILQDAGYRVRAALDGRLALRSAMARAPSLVLLDLQMPPPDGFEVCRRLREAPETSAVPIIVVSGHADEPSKVRAFELGAVDYVSKPYLSAEILARVATHLRLHQLHSELERQNAELREESARREALVQQLGASLERVKLLSGIIPICAHCRKVRDDRGYWQQVEDFVEAHSAALFSHSLCVECCERYYPDENNG